MPSLLAGLAEKAPPLTARRPMTSVAVQVVESLRSKHRVDGRNGAAVAVGLSLETGTCQVNHVVCGEWGWYRGPGSVPPMLRGDVITAVDGHIVGPTDVGQHLRAGPLGSKVFVNALRGDTHTTVEATLVRQDAHIVDGLVSVESALNEVKSAAQALGGRPGSVLEARLAALGRQVAKLGSACAKQESLLSEKYSVHQKHIKELEDAIIRLAQGEGDIEDEAGKTAVEGLRERDRLHQQIQELLAEAVAQASLASELADAQQQLREAGEREVSRAVADSVGMTQNGGSATPDGQVCAELEAKVRQLQSALGLAKTDLAAARLEREKALSEVEKTKQSANDMLRVAQKDVADEKGARELANTKMLVAKREAEEAKASRDADKKRLGLLEKELAQLRGSASALQKQLDERSSKFDAERAQIRDKANALIKDKDAQMTALRKELQDKREEADHACNAMLKKEREAADLSARLKALEDRSSAEAKALDEKARRAREELVSSQQALAEASDARTNAELELDRMRKQAAGAHGRTEELEQLVLRSQEQAGSLKDAMWNLEQRLEEASRTKVEVEHECARLIQEMRALRLQQEDSEASMEHLRAIVRKAEEDMSYSQRQSEEASMDMAKLRMSNAELQGRLTEAEQRMHHVDVALENEKAEHMETERKLRDALSLLERVRSEQREALTVHTSAIEEQHVKEADELKRQAAEEVRRTEDRVRELQREVVAKEEQRAAMLRHAEGLERKLVQAQEEARAYLKTVEGTGEKHKSAMMGKDDAMRKLQQQVQQLEQTIVDQHAEHKRVLDTSCAELKRSAMREKEQMLGERKAELDKAMATRQEAECSLKAKHREEVDALRRALRETTDAEIDRIKARLREEQHKNSARIASLEDVNREMAARSEQEVRDKMQALESDMQRKIDKAFEEAAERTSRVEMTWRGRLEQAEAMCKQRVGQLEKELCEAKGKLGSDSQQMQAEHVKELGVLREEHSKEVKTLRDELSRERDAVRSQQDKDRDEHMRSQQEMKDKHKEELDRLRAEMRERETEMRQQLQSLQVQHEADVLALKDAHAADVEHTRGEGIEARRDVLDRLALKEAELEKLRQVHRDEVKNVHKEMGGLREEMAREVESANRVKREHEAAVVELAAVRASEQLLQTMIKDVRAEGAAREEEERKRAAIVEAELAALRMEHAQLEGKMATSSSEVDRLKGVVANVSKEVPGLKAQLHESVCAQAELQGRLHAAEEEIAAFDLRMKDERAELEQERNKVATLQSAVVDREKMEVKLAKMEDKMSTVSALEEHLASLSQELAESHSKVAALEQAAADARQRKLGAMASVVPASFDKWTAMPKSPFTMSGFSVPSWGKKDTEDQSGADESQRDASTASDRGSGGVKGGVETDSQGGLDQSMREMELERQLAEARLEIERLERRLEGGDSSHLALGGDAAGVDTDEASDRELEDGGAITLRQQLSEARQARAAAEKDAYNVRREMAAMSRSAEGEKEILVGAHRKEIERLRASLAGDDSAPDEGDDDFSDMVLQLRAAREEIEGAHEAARVADAAANAAELRVRELERERQEDFIGYRERESKSREHVMSLAKKLSLCEEELEQLKKRLWVKEREAQMLQKQLDAMRSEGAGMQTNAWHSSAMRHRAGDDVRELQHRLAATEKVLAERTHQLRDLEEQLGTAAESTWSQAQGFSHDSRKGKGRGGGAPRGCASAGVALPKALAVSTDPLQGDALLPSDASPGGHGAREQQIREVQDEADEIKAQDTGVAADDVSTAGVPAIHDRASLDRGFFGDLGLTARSLGGSLPAWPAKLPFLGADESQKMTSKSPTSAYSAAADVEVSSATAPAQALPIAPPPVSPAPAILPKSPSNAGQEPAAQPKSRDTADSAVSSQWGWANTDLPDEGGSGGRSGSAGMGFGDASMDSGRRGPADKGERWVGVRASVQDAVAESRAARGFYHELEREREAASEVEQIRSARSAAGSGPPGRSLKAGASLVAHADDSIGARSGRDWLLEESSEEMMERLRGKGTAAAEDEIAASLFLSAQWLDEVGGAGKGTSGATTAGLIGPRTASLRRSAESSLWSRSALDVVAPSVA